MKRSLIGIGAALVVAATAGPAAAHVTVQPPEAQVGSFSRFVVRVPNERDDASTTKVEVRFPQELFFVSFQDIEGWERDVNMRKLEEPVELFGSQVTEVVGAVTWSGGRIGPGEFEEFGFTARVPEDEGMTLEFPAIQTYSSGEVVRWIGPADAEEPAATVSTVDLGVPEGTGELGAIDRLSEEVASLRGAPEGDGSEAAPPRDESSGSATMGIVLGAIGIGLGALALLAALLKRRA